MPRASSAVSAASQRSKSFDPENYQLIPALKWESFFVVGRIIQIQLPAGRQHSKKKRSGGRLGPSDNSVPQHLFRRLVIVKTGSKVSVCLPIKTYENQATTRSDVRGKQHEHAAIYTGMQPPALLAGESGLQEPIQADAESQATSLSPLARINYGITHEIQHTEKVYNLGKVTDGCIGRLQRTFERISGQSSTPEPGLTRKRTYDEITDILDKASFDGERPQIFSDGYAGGSRVAYATPNSLDEEEPFGHGDKVVKKSIFFEPLSNAEHVFGALLDTGASRNFISEAKAAQLGAKCLRYQGPEIQFGNGKCFAPSSILSSCWQLKDKPKTYMDHFVVIPDLPADVVIGRDTIFERKFLLPNEELAILGLKRMSEYERRAQEAAADAKAAQNLRQELKEREEIERRLRAERDERQARFRGH